MKRKKITLQERAARASDRLRKRSESGTWANGHDGFLAGYRAAQREARMQIKLLKKQIEYQTKRADQATEDRNRYAREADRFEQALRDYARGAMNETRHPFKELRP